MSRFNADGGISNEDLREAAEYVRDNDARATGCDAQAGAEVDYDFEDAAKLIAAAILARLDGKEDFYDGGSP
jgi:hypothetical protein